MTRSLISAGCAYYGGADPRHLLGTHGLLHEGIPFVAIKGCAYPEMAKSHVTAQAMEFDVDCLLVFDSDVAFDASEARRLGELALEKDGIVTATLGELKSGHVRRTLGNAGLESVAVSARPWSPEYANDLAFAAIPLSALREIAKRESREYTNTPIVATKRSKENRPFFSPWRQSPGTLKTIPLEHGVYCNPDRAFLLRAQEVGVPIIRAAGIRHQILSGAGYSVRIQEGSAEKRREHGIPNYAVCLPTFGALDVDQQEQLFELEKAGVSIAELHNCPFIDLARAELTRIALEVLECDGIFFLDHDIMFRPIDMISIMREAEERQDVVAAVYCMRKSAHSLIGAIEEEGHGPIVFFEGGSVRPALYTGLGFAAVPRAVVDSLAESYPLLDGGFPGDVLPLYALDVNGGYYAGEDVSFCSRVQGLTVKHFPSPEGGDDWSLDRAANPTGHKILVDTRVRILHKGSYEYGIEDEGFVVPRYKSLKGLVCRTREEVRAAVRTVAELSPETQDRSLGVDDAAEIPHPIILANEELTDEERGAAE